MPLMTFSAGKISPEPITSPSNMIMKSFLNSDFEQAKVSSKHHISNSKKKDMNIQSGAKLNSNMKIKV